MSDFKQIALNSPSVLGYYGVWEITQETVLYNLSDEIVGYCYDMINLSESSTVSQNDNEPATAYVIVNADTKGFPILLFGADGTSAYLGGGYDKMYYFGTLDFYLEVDEDVVNARANEELSSSDIDMFASSQGQISSKKEDYSSVREAYLGGDDSVVVSKSVSSNSDSLALAPLSVLPEAGSVSIGQNLQWRKGCAPTAVAMLICTKYSIFDGNKVIDALAGHMQTDSAGATAIQRVTSGTNLFFINDTNLAAPKTCGRNSPDSASAPRKGVSYNSTDTFKSSINAGFPVGVYCSSSNIQTSGFRDGIGAHMMAGVRYSFNSAVDYIICYTTNTADGKVNFPLTSAGLANHAWFLMRW